MKEEEQIEKEGKDPLCVIKKKEFEIKGDPRRTSRIRAPKNESEVGRMVGKKEVKKERSVGDRSWKGVRGKDGGAPFSPVGRVGDEISVPGSRRKESRQYQVPGRGGGGRGTLTGAYKKL